jgi:hypothetical protein
VVEAGRVIDASAGFSFSLPLSWQLDPKSRPGDVGLLHQETGSTFWVILQPEAMDLATEYKSLKLAVPFLGGKWSLVSDRWTKVGNLKAGVLESRRELADHKTWHEWHLICVKKSRALMIWLSVPEDRVEASRKDLEQILSSFEWKKK